MQKKVVNASIFLVICIILAACGPSEAERNAQALATSTPTKKPTATSTSTPIPTSTSTPTRTPTATPDLRSIFTAIAPVARRQGVPEAATYDPDSPGPHPVVLLTESGLAHRWNHSLPAEWLPSSVSETELIIVVGAEKENALGSASYAGCNNKTVRVFRYRFELDVVIREARTGRPLRTATLRGPEPAPFPATLSCGATRIDGEHVNEGALRAWLMCEVIIPEVCEMSLLEEGTSPVSSVIYSPDGQTLAAGTALGGVYLWHISDGSLAQELEGPTLLTNIAFSPDGQTLAAASASARGYLHVWQVSEGALLYKQEVESVITSVAFSPDGQTLALGFYDIGTHGIMLLRASDGTLLSVLEEDTGSVDSIAFSPDGQILASGSTVGSIRLWRVSDGILLLTLEWHTDPVTSVAFSPDGQALASGSMDGSIRLWRVSDGSLLLNLWGHAGPVRSVAFSPDGQTLASGSEDMTVRLWTLP